MRLQLATGRAMAVVAVLASVAGSCGLDGGVAVEVPLAPDAPATTAASAGVDDPDGDALDGAGLDGGLDDDPAADGTPGDGGGAGGTLVPLGSNWRLASVATADWMDPDFDDAAWPSLPTPVGRGYDVVSSWDEPGVLFARTSFDADFGTESRLELRVRRDDGAIAYLDGEEVGRWNMDAGSPADDVDGADGYTYLVALLPGRGDGQHVLAVEIHQRTDPDLVFDARLRVVDESAPVGVVLIQLRSESYGGAYAPDNVGAVWIETAEGDFVKTLSVWANVRREHLVAWNAAGAGDETDAITAATAGSHGTRLVEWDLTDATGVQVLDGDYVVRAEFTEANSNEGAAAGPAVAIPFSTHQAGLSFAGRYPGFADFVVIPAP